MRAPAGKSRTIGEPLLPGSHNPSGTSRNSTREWIGIVTSNSPDALQQVFPSSELWRGHGLKAFLWSAAGSFTLALIFLNLFLLVDLLATGQYLLVPADDQTAIQLLTRTPPDASVQAGVNGGTHLVYSNQGLIGPLWHSREQPWGWLVRQIYFAVPHGTDINTLVFTLCLSAIALMSLRWGLHSQSQIHRRRAAVQVADRVRTALHRQAVRLGPSTWKSEEENRLLALFTTDVDRLREVVFRRLDTLGSAPVKLSILLLLLLAMHPVLTIQCLIPLGACWYLYNQDRRRAEQQQRLALDRAGSELGLLAESLKKTRLTSGFHIEDFARDRFEKNLSRYDDLMAGVLKNQGFTGWRSKLFLILCAGLILYLVSVKVLLTPDDLSFGTALIFVAALLWLYFPLESLWQARLAKREGIEVAARLQRYLEQIPAVGQMIGAKFLAPLSRMLEFDAVTYVHPTSKKVLLNELSVKIPAGRKVAVIATDPQEAWAFASLLPRFIDPQSGTVKIDSEDVARVTLDSLRAEVACVWAQESFFSGTVRENLALGSESLTLPQVMEAAKMSHAHNFISLLPLGYETLIGEHGEELDEGQAFRLSLARACLRNPALMVVEEPATRLDEATKDLIEDAYQRIEPNRTMIFLPTRLSTLRRADEIILLHQGKVAAIGPHAQLVKKDPLYRHWEYLHFNEYRHQLELQPEAV